MKQGLGLWLGVACVLVAANAAYATGAGSRGGALSTEQVQQLNTVKCSTASVMGQLKACALGIAG